jgi:hypothetical protein
MLPREVLDQVVGSLDPIDLPEVLRVAELQTRMDRKYLVSTEQVADLVGDLDGRYRVLRIDGRGLFGYESVYFDTPDLMTFRAHQQGRRCRFKVRTRTYADTGDCLVEVKLKGRRGVTVKERLVHAPEARDRLDGPARAFVNEVLSDFDAAPDWRLDPVLHTRYHRATLVDPDEGARLTFDIELGFCGPDGVASGPDRVIVESKSAGAGDADRALARRGVRAVCLSKYCVGIALTRPGVTANRWNRVLRREFGWSPLDSPEYPSSSAPASRTSELPSPVASWSTAWPALS